MVVLQAYQAVLFKDLYHSEGLGLEAIKELCRATDLAFQTTKQMACAIGHSTWLNTLTILNVLKPPKANKIMLAKPKKNSSSSSDRNSAFLVIIIGKGSYNTGSFIGNFFCLL